jgi:1-deoxy-D-xylulose-5-phosphate reductoisomerase
MVDWVSRRTVTVLGATGSVGRSTLDLIEREPERFQVLALTARHDVAGLAEAARRVGAQRAVIGDPALYDELKTHWTAAASSRPPASMP